jgi:hypothetical protein
MNYWSSSDHQLVEFSIPIKLVKLIKMVLNGAYSKVHIGKHLLDAFSIHSGLKQGNALSPLPLSFVLKCAIRKVQKKQDILELDGTQWLLVCAFDVRLLGKNIKAIKKNTEALLDASKEAGLEVCTEKTKYIFMSHY